MRLRAMRPTDWGAVRTIHEEGLATGHAGFESSCPPWETWDRGHLPAPRIVAVDGDRVLGWAALGPVSGRCVHAGVAEVSVYVAARERGRGVGRLLLTRLIEESEAAGLWTLEAGIFPENEASLELHRKLGFREVGRRERIGRLEGRWRDVLLLERRSPTVGR